MLGANPCFLTIQLIISIPITLFFSSLVMRGQSNLMVSIQFTLFFFALVMFREQGQKPRNSWAESAKNVVAKNII